MNISKIGWTDYSGGDLNFVTGCTPVSAGCKNCYARSIYDRFDHDFTPTAHEDKLYRLGKLRFPEYSPKRGTPHKPMCFVCDTGDLFHESISDEFIEQALSVMGLCENVIWQILTKRPARMQYLVTEWCRDRDDVLRSAPNIWLGVTAENQAMADERIPLLLDTPAAVRFVSVEPMLERIDMRLLRDRPCKHSGCLHHVSHPCEGCGYRAGRLPIDWVICGAESGRGRRPFSATWASELHAQCKAAGVPFFGKQDTGLKPGSLLLIEGKEVKEWPR